MPLDKVEIDRLPCPLAEGPQFITNVTLTRESISGACKKITKGMCQQAKNGGTPPCLIHLAEGNEIDKVAAALGVGFKIKCKPEEAEGYEAIDLVALCEATLAHCTEAVSVLGEDKAQQAANQLSQALDNLGIVVTHPKESPTARRAIQKAKAASLEAQYRSAPPEKIGDFSALMLNELETIIKTYSQRSRPTRSRRGHERAGWEKDRALAPDYTDILTPIATTYRTILKNAENYMGPNTDDIRIAINLADRDLDDLIRILNGIPSRTSIPTLCEALIEKLKEIEDLMK